MESENVEIGQRIAEKVPYLAARLAIKKDRWEIVFYQTDPTDGKRKRHRETGDLNRIKDLRERKKQACALVTKINAMLPEGYPYGREHQPGHNYDLQPTGPDQYRFCRVEKTD